MGVDTHGIIGRKVEQEELFNFINQRYQNAKPYFGSSSGYDLESGRINFTSDDGKDRSLYFLRNNLRKADKYIKEMFGDEGEYVWMSLGCFGDSVDIMKTILTQFGGYIDENDCDEEGYYPVNIGANGNIKPVLRITLEELYEKLGATVIITDLQNKKLG